MCLPAQHAAHVRLSWLQVINQLTQPLTGFVKKIQFDKSFTALSISRCQKISIAMVQ